MELLTIITRTLQIFSSFFLVVILFSLVTIKIKSRINKNGILTFSRPMEGKTTMQEGISTKVSNDSDIMLDYKEPSSLKNDSKTSNSRKKIRVYAVYNPNSNPNYYLHNKLIWFKDFS